jgi:hypothetical protein
VRCKIVRCRAASRGDGLNRVAGWSFVVTMLAMLIGCGGGGGGAGGGGGGGTTGGQYQNPMVTAYGSQNQMLDTRALLVGDVIQLDITAYNQSNQFVVLPASGWKTNAPSSVATLSSSGQLTAVGASATTYAIEVNFNGTNYTANLIVSAPLDLVTGLVRNSSNPIRNVIVDFYDKSGNQVGVTYTARDGTFRASVPGTATQYTIDMSLADPGNIYYYPQFTYGTNEYLEGTPSCLTALPTPLSSTAVTPLPNPVIPYLRSIGPPPPPTGCVG